MPVVLVEVWSDVVCPWCHVGKARFEEAVRRLGWEDDVEVVYRPFELPPRPPGFRRPGNSLARIAAAGEVLGLTFDWASAKRRSTFDAHRLLAWALDTAGAKAQGRLKTRLMQAYFAEGVDVSDHGELGRLAAEVGLDATGVLDGDAYADSVRAGEAEAAELDIYAVPTFVIGRSLVVPGAQDPETFVSLLARARERLAPG